MKHTTANNRTASIGPGRKFRALLFVVIVLQRLPEASVSAEENQYAFEDITVPPARESEPIRQTFSLQKAVEYMEAGAKAWTRENACISCHTNGSYMLLRPALSGMIGKPSNEIREFYVSQLKEWESLDRSDLITGFLRTQIAYLAGGLAEWDANVVGTLSAETVRALEFMFRAQSKDGSFKNAASWPPYESSSFIVRPSRRWR